MQWLNGVPFHKLHIDCCIGHSNGAGPDLVGMHGGDSGCSWMMVVHIPIQQMQQYYPELWQLKAFICTILYC